MSGQRPNLMSQVGVMRMTAALLGLAATDFAEQGERPLDLRQFLPRVEDRRALMRSIHEWDGSPELYNDAGEYETLPDSLAARWLAAQVDDRVEALLAEAA
jgi:hypothetical protein